MKMKRKTRVYQRSPPPLERSPVLQFSPTAWAKLLWFRDFGPTEVGGFGLATAEDLLRVDDVELVRQRCTPVTVQFEDVAVADFFDRQVDRGLTVEQFGRIWIHTHPGNCPEPSGTDEDTFDRVFGRSEWAIMFILARGGESYARLRFSVGPGGDMLLPVTVDFSQPFAGSGHAAWQAEYESNVDVLPAFDSLHAEPWGSFDDLEGRWSGFAGPERDWLDNHRHDSRMAPEPDLPF